MRWHTAPCEGRGLVASFSRRQIISEDYREDYRFPTLSNGREGSQVPSHSEANDVVRGSVGCPTTTASPVYLPAAFPDKRLLTCPPAAWKTKFGRSVRLRRSLRAMTPG